MDLTGNGFDDVPLSPATAQAQADVTGGLDIIGDNGDLVRLLPGWEAVSADDAFVTFQSGDTTLRIANDVRIELQIQASVAAGGPVVFTEQSDSDRLELIQNETVLFAAHMSLLRGDGPDDDPTVLVVHGTALGDRIDASGYSLPVHLKGHGGRDRLIGSPQGDTLDGGGANDRLEGRGGPDVIRGGWGDDLIRGQGGHDTLGGDEGDDTLEGGTGNDRRSESATRGSTDLLRLTDDGLTGLGSDQLSEPLPIVELIASPFPTRIDASGYTLTRLVIRGGERNDTLIGGTLNDTLVGNGGDDVLEGGDGRDR